MRVLVTGAGGQVGREIARLGPSLGIEVLGLDRAALDVTDAGAVRASVSTVRPDAVIHAAAYTAVDRAETEPTRAYSVNADGARHVAEAATEANAALVALSTDYVFEGTRRGPYAPTDAVSPLNVYGASKAAGERAITEAHANALVLRTAWVVSPYPGNFATTMLRLARERDRLRVVADQWGHPTPAADVATVALGAARALRDGLGGGVAHAAGQPLATWHALAEAVVDEGARAGLCPRLPIDPIPTTAYPTPAARPGRVELSMTDLGLPPIDWLAGVAEIVQRVAAGRR